MELMGIHEVKADAKGRVGIPKAFRDKIEGAGITELIVTTNLEGKLPFVEVVLPEEWQRVMDKLAEEPQFDPMVARFRKIWVLPGQPVSLDTAGRVLVPPYHRTWGKVDREIIVTGGNNRFAIWDAALFRQSVDQTAADDFDEVKAVMAPRLR